MIGILKEVKQEQRGIDISKGASISGMLFANDFVG